MGELGKVDEGVVEHCLYSANLGAEVVDWELVLWECIRFMNYPVKQIYIPLMLDIKHF